MRKSHVFVVFWTKTKCLLETILWTVIFFKQFYFSFWHEDLHEVKKKTSGREVINKNQFLIFNIFLDEKCHYVLIVYENTNNDGLKRFDTRLRFDNVSFCFRQELAGNKENKFKISNALDIVLIFG